MNPKPDIVVNVDLTRCASGNVVGVMQELPIVAQANNVNELSDKMRNILVEHLAHDKKCISVNIMS